MIRKVSCNKTELGTVKYATYWILIAIDDWWLKHFFPSSGQAIRLSDEEKPQLFLNKILLIRKPYETVNLKIKYL